jgi:hypothetical protein
MTAVVEIKEKYLYQFKQFVDSMPKDSVKLTMLKQDLNLEIQKRVDEIKAGLTESKPLDSLSYIREIYAKH